MKDAQSIKAKPKNAVKRPVNTKDLAIAGMFAAVLAVISQISIPMPTGVPITIQIFGVALVGVILGWRLGVLATVVYIVLGAVGLPIFANFRGGIQMIFGLTGGYIWAWPIMIFFCGLKPKTPIKALNTLLLFLLPVLGTIINELIGGLQWAALSGDMSVYGVFTYSMVAFVPKDVLLTVMAVILGLPIRKVIQKQL
ncbi:biotin transporter BioY [Lacrimispora sp. JR3]|uniref:biotin transporter BioY n=1 Tax=Lacrimispora sinapis TaxID=3111456 RepID=UPI0037486146